METVNGSQGLSDESINTILRSITDPEERQRKEKFLKGFSAIAMAMSNLHVLEGTLSSETTVKIEEIFQGLADAVEHQTG